MYIGHLSVRMDSITESKMETVTSSSSTNPSTNPCSRDGESGISTENLSVMFKGIMKNGQHGSRAIFREISFIDDEVFEDNGLDYR